MMKPVFSIVIPIYNAEKYLSKTLDSVQKQDYQSFEVLLIDDGSSDSSADICMQFSSKDNRFHLYQKSNGGVCSARNYGIEKATGEYILFIDSDDIVEPMMLSDCLKLIQESGADILLFGMQFDIEKQEKTVKSFQKRSGPVLFDGKELDKYYRKLYEDNYVTSMCNRITKMRLIRENHLQFNEKITNYEDMAFSLECLRYAEKIQSTDKCYYHYILHDELGMSRKYKPTLSATIPKTVELLIKNLDALPLSEATKIWAHQDVQRILWLGVANICREKASIYEKSQKIKQLCSQPCVRLLLPMEMTNNRYNDICIVLYRKKMWTAETLWNMFTNKVRDIRY